MVGPPSGSLSSVVLLYLETTEVEGKLMRGLDYVDSSMGLSTQTFG